MRWIARNSSGTSQGCMDRFIDSLPGFCSLKKVQGKKKRDAAATEALRKALEEARAVDEVASPPPETLDEEETISGDLLSSKDEDVIF